MLIVRTGDVAHAFFNTEGLQPATSAVVQHPDREIRIVENQRADDCLLDHVERLSVGWNKDVNAGQTIRRHGPQPRLVTVGFRAPVAGAQKCDVQNECVTERTAFDNETEPDPYSFGA